MQTPVKQLSVQDVKAKLDSGETFRLIDVREPNEHAVAQIEGAELLPLSQHERWIDTLPSDQELVFFCHAGSRSQQVASYLAQRHGRTNVANMVGGIDAWSRQIDPAVPRY